MTSKVNLVKNRYSNLITQIKPALKKWTWYNYLRDISRQHKYNRKINSYIHHCLHEKQALFDTVEIETLNRCNGTCSFCPVNKHADSRPYQMMDTDLFISIINQLKAVDYNKGLALYSNNEPFLDGRIINFAQIAREALPEAHIFLYTNGTLLTLEKFLAIIPFLDRMVIDNYNDNLKLNPASQIISDYCVQNSLYASKVEIQIRKTNEILTTRGGQAPNNTKKRTLKIPCIQPFRQVVIRPDGKISLCCNDALGKFTLGDLNKQSLLEIWHSDNYRDIRHKMQKGRAEISLCQFCDSIYRV